MKIVCDACQAKYSISDDKVQGKVFKIRCKKCSNIIVVRGGAGASDPAPVAQEKDTRVYDYGYDGGEAAPGGDEAVWHLVINQDQVGPMTAGEVQQRFASGEVDGETFTWREGFADWLPLAQVDAFAALVASGSTTAALPPGGGGAAAVSAMFAGGDDGGTTRNDPGDLFAASSHASRHHDDDGADLFGSKPDSGGDHASASAQKLRGERNENSVLFSLNNLAQLASDKPAPSASVVSAPSGHATGAAGGEGSGLIDIRSMASAYLGGSGAAPGKPAASAGIGSIDDLPVFGGGGFSEPAVIVPTARAAANNKLLYGMLAAVGGLALVAIILVIVLVRGSKKPVVVASNTPAASADKATDTAAGDKADDKAPDTAGSAAPAAQPAAGSAEAAAAQPAAAATPAPAAAAAQPAEHAAPAHEEHHAATHAAHHEVVASHETHHEATHTEAAKPSGGDSGGGGGCDEVSCVLNSYAGACCAKFKKGGGGGGGGGGGHVDSNLPEQLDASMVGSGLGSIRGRVSACGNRSSAKGAVKVHVKVGGSGRVESVSVLSSPDGGLGNCVQSAVYHASFPKTQRGGSFNYPFVF